MTASPRAGGMGLRTPIGRLGVQFGLALAMAMVLAGGIVFMAARHQLIDEDREMLERERAMLLAPGQDLSVRALAARIAALEAGRAFSTKGHVLYDSRGRQVWGRIALPLPSDGYSTVRFRDDVAHMRQATVLTMPVADGGHLAIMIRTQVSENLREMLPAALIGLFLTATVLAMATGFAITRSIALRIERIQHTAQAIAEGNLALRIPLKGLDGIFAEQAASLNTMLDRMEDMVNSHRGFASHLAHDLRTPLARLRNLLADNLPRPDVDRLALWERVERECASIIAIFDALLRLSEIEAGRHPSAMRPLSLAAVIEEVAETMEPVMTEENRRLDLLELAAVDIMADSAMVQQLLVNLIENIVHHTPPGTLATIALALDETGQSAIVTLADNGPGIAQTDRLRVLAPFERGRGSHLPQGSGLGLAIAQAIMRFHGGDLALERGDPGLVVRLAFPLSGRHP